MFVCCLLLVETSFRELTLEEEEIVLVEMKQSFTTLAIISSSYIIYSHGLEVICDGVCLIDELLLNV